MFFALSVRSKRDPHFGVRGNGRIRTCVAVAPNFLESGPVVRLSTSPKCGTMMVFAGFHAASFLDWLSDGGYPAFTISVRFFQSFVGVGLGFFDSVFWVTRVLEGELVDLLG